MDKKCRSQFQSASSRLKPALRLSILTAPSILEIQASDKLAKESHVNHQKLEEKPRCFAPIIPAPYSKEYRDFVTEK